MQVCASTAGGSTEQRSDSADKSAGKLTSDRRSQESSEHRFGFPANIAVILLLEDCNIFTFQSRTLWSCLCVCLFACLFVFFPWRCKRSWIIWGHQRGQLTTQDFELSHFLGCIS